MSAEPKVPLEFVIGERLRPEALQWQVHDADHDELSEHADRESDQIDTGEHDPEIGDRILGSGAVRGDPHAGDVGRPGSEECECKDADRRVSRRPRFAERSEDQHRDELRNDPRADECDDCGASVDRCRRRRRPDRAANPVRRASGGGVTHDAQR